jgi:hypothetical protein
MRILFRQVIDNDRPGEYGFMLLRSLIVMFIIILCFAVLAGGVAVYAHQGTVLLDRILKSIQGYNETQLNQVNL